MLFSRLYSAGVDPAPVTVQLHHQQVHTCISWPTPVLGQVWTQCQPQDDRNMQACPLVYTPWVPMSAPVQVEAMLTGCMRVCRQTWPRALHASGLATWAHRSMGIPSHGSQEERAGGCWNRVHLLQGSPCRSAAALPLCCCFAACPAAFALLCSLPEHAFCLHHAAAWSRNPLDTGLRTFCSSLATPCRRGFSAVHRVGEPCSRPSCRMAAAVRTSSVPLVSSLDPTHEHTCESSEGGPALRAPHVRVQSCEALGVLAVVASQPTRCAEMMPG